MNKIIWFAYISGAILVLVCKWLNWVCKGKIEHNKDVWTSTKEWFSLALLMDKVSWLSTIALVWVLGSMYVYALVIDIPGLGWLPAVPRHISIAFLFGILAEMVAPAILKKIVGKFVAEG